MRGGGSMGWWLITVTRTLVAKCGSFGVDCVDEGWGWGRRCGATSPSRLRDTSPHRITRGTTARDATKSSGCEKKTARLSPRKMDVLEKLGQVYLSQGVTVGKIAHKIAEETGMSYRWVMNYLPDKCKARSGLRGPSRALSFDKHKEKT